MESKNKVARELYLPQAGVRGMNMNKVPRLTGAGASCNCVAYQYFDPCSCTVSPINSSWVIPTLLSEGGLSFSLLACGSGTWPNTVTYPLTQTVLLPMPLTLGVFLDGQWGEFELAINVGNPSARNLKQRFLSWGTNVRSLFLRPLDQTRDLERKYSLLYLTSISSLS